jgi:transcriptional regulator with XRE-family HTH domain
LRKFILATLLQMTKTFDYTRFDQFLKNRKLKAVQVAADMDISESTVSRYRKGLLPLEDDFLRKFSKKYNCSVEDFVVLAKQNTPVTEDQGSQINWQKKYLQEVEQNKKLLAERSDLTAKIELLEKSDLAQNAKIWAIEEFLMQLAAEVRRPDQSSEVRPEDVDAQSLILGKLEGAALRRSLGKSTPVSGSADKKGNVPGKAKVR